jgi:integrase
MTLKEDIKKQRPKLSEGSLNTYASLLKSLYNNVFDSKDVDLERFNKDDDKIIKHLEDLPPNKRKTILSALLVVTSNDKYKKLMMGDIKEYSNEIKKQEKTETQKKNSISNDEIKSKWNELREEAEHLYKKKQLNSNDLQQIQKFIILSLFGGIFVPPRRNLDYSEMKIKDIDKKTDNYIDKNSFVFNRYKTDKFHGQQKETIPPALLSILKKWIKTNPNEYLLFDADKGDKLNSVQVTQRINRIFGKNISVNTFRHTYLTEKYGDTIKKNNEIQKDMESMGSSANMLTTYVKND